MQNILESSSKEAVSNDRHSLLEILRQWGGVASDAVLDPICKIFRVVHINGFIGYRLDSSCAVVYGNPISAPEDTIALALAFESYCKKQGWSTVYVCATGWFADWAIKNICGALVECGYELFIDPQCDPRSFSGTHGSLVRRKVRHAQKSGVTVQEYVSDNPFLEQAMEGVGNRWLQGRKGPQVHISNVHLFDDRFGKRWFYAKQGENVVGLLVLNQLQSQQGWLLNHLMFIPEAAHGTAELLVIAALETLAKEGCHFVSFGYVTSDKLGNIMGLGKFSVCLVQMTFTVMKAIFHLEGHFKFWEKFHPKSESSYILFQNSNIRLNQILSLMRALNVHIKSP